MTKRERTAIRKAIRLIHHEDNYYGGMDILARLAGLRVRKDKIVETTIAELCKNRENREFFVEGE